ncbi:MAG: glycerol-3-phosphate 1-O-acyltransferase PlsY [Rhodospirillaceae bacterium]|jgi:acyl phosphate:glycerol-3-phosphate acyltransferase|nr:glycerol-3-phosphate 1-O-acyltransferase PlsY [Rhodospirillaceae bacterium]
MNAFEPYQAFAAALGYLLGSVPFGLVLTRLAGLGDIREIGSGNIGATNVLRTGNKFLAFLTLLCDSGKGAAAAVLAAYIWNPEAGLIAGFMAVFGHNFPVWLKFKGGKGFATTLGVLLFTAWPVCIGACATWLLTAGVFRYSSLAALVALAAAPAYAYWMDLQAVALMAGGLAMLGFFRHHENIARLIKGEESKIGGKKSEPAETDQNSGETP